MKKRNWVTYGLFALVVLGVYFANVEVQSYLGRKTLDESGLVIHELPEAMTLAGSQSKMILANLSAIWCPTCRKIDKTVLSDPRVQDVINKRFVFSRIEYESDAGSKFQERYNVSGFPRLLVLAPDGKKIRMLDLTTDPDHFISQLSF